MCEHPSKQHAVAFYRDRGFSVIELMVAVVIGLVAAIVIMQMFGLSEGRKRATTSGADAQTTAGVALYLMERDLRQAGYGFAPTPEEFVDSSSSRFKAPPTGVFQDGILAQCETVVAYNSGRAGANSFSYTNSTFSPIVINPPGFAAGDTGSDVILVNYAGSNGITGASVMAKPVGTVTSSQVGGTGQDFVAKTASLGFPGFYAGDLFVAVPSKDDAIGKTCLLGEITGFGFDTDGYPAFLWNNSLSYQSYYDGVKTAVWNTPPGTALTWSKGYGRIYDLGKSADFVSRVYAVRNGNLTMCDLNKYDCRQSTSSYWLPIASGVVAMQAQYGLDADYDGAVDSSGWKKTQPTGTARATIVAARIALVAKNSQYEKAADFVASTPVWHSDATGTSNINIDVSSLVSNWTHYRYNVAQTIIPLRNMMWGQQK